VPQLSDFRLGADVVGNDGAKAGTLVSVLVEAKAFEPKAIVVKDETSLLGRLISEEKLFITDEVVIPISAVESATHEQVRLSIPAAEVKKQKPYLSYQLEPETPTEALEEEGELLSGGLALPKADEIADKPAGEIEIDKDENVMLGTSGRRLGRVQEVLYDKDRMVGVVIRPEGYFKQDVVLPARFISRADDMALFASLDESAVESLKPFEESS
jgi:uncharacterized protein YrrD